MQRRQLIQILFQSHVKIGMIVAALFYVAMYFGTIVMMEPYLNTWEKPSRHFTPIGENQHLDLDSVIGPRLSDPKWPAGDLIVTLPGREDPSVSIRHQFSKPQYYHPLSGEILDDEGSGLTRFFVLLHYGRVLDLPGMFLMGIACVGVVFLTINGWWLSLRDGKKPVPMKNMGVRSMERWHRVLSQWLTPLVFILALTSAYFGVMFTIGGSGISYAASEGKTMDMSSLLGPALFPKEEKLPATNQKAEMVSLNELYQKARENYPEMEIQQMVVDRWGNTDARITFKGPLKENIFLTERVNRLWIRFSGVDGALIEKHELDDSNWMQRTLSGFYFFHFITDTDFFFRLCMFLGGLGITLSVGAGLLAWLYKQYQKKPDNIISNFIWSRFFTAVFVGVVPATALVFLMNWILPFDLAERSIWLRGILYLSWMATFIWAAARLNHRKVVGEQLLLGGILFCLVPLIHGFQSGYFIWNSLAEGLMPMAGTDIGILLFGVAFTYIGWWQLKKEKTQFESIKEPA